MSRRLMQHLYRIALFALTATTLFSQSDVDAVRPFVGVGGPGGRAEGLGQTFTGIADDATALFYNPAGLALLTKGEISLGFSNLNSTTEVTDAQGTKSGAITATRLTNFGLALPVPDSKLTVAFGFHRLQAFDRYRKRTVSNGADSAIRETLTEEGSLGAFGLGLGYQVSPLLSLGGGIDILAGDNAYNDSRVFLTGTHEDSSDNLSAEPVYTGLALNIGMLMSPLPAWRIGLLLRSPQAIQTTEKSFDSYIGYWESREYRIRGPYSLRCGSSLALGPFLIAGDLSWFDYSQIRFSSDITFPSGVPIDPFINDTLRTSYASTLSYAAGAELLLPVVNAKLRGGFRYDPPIYPQALVHEAQLTFAVGASFVPVKQMKIDAAYSLTTWERDLNGQPEQTTVGQGSLNLVYRF